MALNIFRVVVRGQFADLDPERREALVRDAASHDIFHSAYTSAGTFTYDERIQAFSFRFEVREHTDDDDIAPAEIERTVLARAEALAIRYLEESAIGYKRLRSNATNMADMWR